MTGWGLTRGRNPLAKGEVSVHGLAWLVATLTGGRLLWRFSLMAEAVKDGSDPGRGTREA